MGSPIGDRRLKIYHVYTTAEGRSSVEEVDVQVAPSPEFAGLHSSPRVSTKSMVFTKSGAAFAMSAHPASRRQLLVVLCGCWEFDCLDGKVLRLEPGDVLFADDLHGAGHVTRELTGDGATLIVPFTDDFDPSQLFAGVSTSHASSSRDQANGVDPRSADREEQID